MRGYSCVFKTLWPIWKPSKVQGPMMQIQNTRLCYIAKLECLGLNQDDVSALLIVLGSNSNYPKREGPDVQNPQNPPLERSIVLLAGSC